MTVLAIDTCRRAQVVAVTLSPSGELIETFHSGGSLAISLPAMIAELLSDDVSDLVVVNGPGSYTGVRAGMSAAFGLVASRGLRLRAIDRLSALAACGTAEVISSLLDAGRGGAYTELFTLDGSGTPRSSSDARHVTLGEWTPPADAEHLSDFPHAGHRAVEAAEIVLAGARTALRNDPVQPDSVRPLYVSQPNWQSEPEASARPIGM